MFARTSRARRVLMPTMRPNRKVHPDPISNKVSRDMSTLKTKYSSFSSWTSAPLPRVHRTLAPAPSRQTPEDRTRTINEYMQKLRRMEPPEDTTDLPEETTSQKRAQKARLMQELKALVPAQKEASVPPPPPPPPSVFIDRGTQTTLSMRTGTGAGGMIKEMKRVIDAYMLGVRRMAPGEDETDKQDEGRCKKEEERAVATLMAQIKQMVEDRKRVDARNGIAKASRKMVRDVEKKASSLNLGVSDIIPPVPVEEDTVKSSNIPPEDISINVDNLTTEPAEMKSPTISSQSTEPVPVVARLPTPKSVYKPCMTISSIFAEHTLPIAPTFLEPVVVFPVSVSERGTTTQTAEMTAIVPTTKAEKKVTIITDIRELDEREDLASTSASVSASASSFNSLLSACSSTDSLDSLSSAVLGEPYTINNDNNDNIKEKGKTIPYTPPPPSLYNPKPLIQYQYQYQPTTPPSALNCPNLEHPPNPWPALTRTLAIGMATFAGLKWLSEAVIDQLRYWALLERRYIPVCLLFGVYLWGLSRVGTLWV